MRRVWFFAMILGVALAGTTLGVRFTEYGQNKQNGTLTQSHNHFSVHWMGFAPADYNNSYPDYYVCINNLKGDQVNMTIALQIKNQESSGYYFLIDQYAPPPPNWTISQYKIGYIAVDNTATFVYSNVSRSKPLTIPQGTLTESINLVVKAYNDSAYTSFYSQDNFTVSFHFIDRTSPAWTQLTYDNFEDGTTQEWTNVGSMSEAALSTTYYRSFQNSFRVWEWTMWSYHTAGFQKTFNTTGYSTSILIFSLRSSRWDDFAIDVNGVTYFKADAPLSANTWYQFAVPIPRGVDRVTIWVAGWLDSYLDDVYLIAS